ncbi:hypothetical protein [Lentzea terrae]|uniref:hypothetical protein n=1 Tax=Lentzea terrae TaxID=2200761 RepID=UPI0013005E78|nr:hypothetical protein [Lentzea terrae]
MTADAPDMVLGGPKKMDAVTPAGELSGLLSEPHAPAGRLVADLAAKRAWW